MEYGGASYSFPRLKHLPDQFVMHWRTAEKFEYIPEPGVPSPEPDKVAMHSQVVKFPKSLKGKKGVLLFLLDENNEWHVSLRDEKDWTKVLLE